MAPRPVGRRNGFFPPSPPPLNILMVTRGKDCPKLLQYYSVIRGHVRVCSHGMASPPWRIVHGVIAILFW